MNETKLDFVFYGGRPCLDLYNTIRKRKDPLMVAQDLLNGSDVFKEWVLKAQKQSDWLRLLPPVTFSMEDEHKTEEIKNQVLLLRDIITRFLAKRYSKTDIEIINQFSKLRPIWSLSLNDNRLSAKANLELESVLGLIAEDTIQLFSLGDLTRIKECTNEHCGIVFYDKSRGNNRNWCSMKTCGNRAKVARFADKK